MKNNDMIERYVYAVSKRLPLKLRKDVSAELNSIISDMLEERCNGMIPTDQDILAVLTELGTPHELAHKYKGTARDCLIGEPHFSNYIWWLKLVLPIAAIGVTISSIVSFIGDPTLNFITLFSNWLSNMITGFISAFGVVTIIFAILYHKGVDVDEGVESLESLLKAELGELDDFWPLPGKPIPIPLWESIFGIVLNIAFAVIMLAVPQVFAIYFGEAGVRIPIFNVDVLRAYWYIIIIWSGLGIFEEVVGLIETKYSIRVMVVNIVSNIIGAVLIIFLLAGRTVINPEATYALLDIFSGANNTVLGFIGNLQMYLLAVILLIMAVDMGVTIFRTLQSNRKI